MGYDRPTYQPFEDVKDATEALNDYFSQHPAAVSHEAWNNYDSDDHDCCAENSSSAPAPYSSMVQCLNVHLSVTAILTVASVSEQVVHRGMRRRNGAKWGI